MKQTWDSETIDSMIERIEALEEENLTLKIGYGKYLNGYRPKDELWCDHDQRAFDLAKGVEPPS